MRRAHWMVSILGVGLALSGCFTSSTDTTTNTDAGDLGPQPDGAAPLDAGAETGDATIVMAEAGGGATGDGGADADADAEAGVVCTASGTPIMHTADIVADETWVSGIHVVPSTIQIKSGARLTVSPCSELQLGPGASIEVTSTAAGLDAVGTASAPIRLVAQQAGNPWGAVDVTAPSVANLAYVTISGGGTGSHASAPRGGASLTGYSTGTARPVVLKLQHVVISGSAGLGLFLQQARFDPASVDLTVTGAGWYPVYLGAASAGDLPSGGMYTGNAIDQILLQTFNVAAYDDSAVLTSDVTLRDLGVPYRVGTTPSSIVVGDGLAGDPSASLTLAAGVHMLFTPQGAGGTSRILVNAQDNAGTYSAQGALVILGTEASPVFLDSAADPQAQAAADWEGLYFANLVDPRTSIAYAHILHAGGASSAVGICGSTSAANNGAATCAIVVLVKSAPAAFLSNSDIEQAPCGVYRGWPTTDVDFLSTNQFVGIAGCTETSIPDAGGQCAACSTSP
jgi:hypothetical protein